MNQGSIAMQWPPTPGPGATQTITFSRSLTTPFPAGTTPVTVTATYSDGLISSCIAHVTVLFTDCNGNGIPDSCEFFYGALHDCNNDGIPDECQCLWDDGSIAASAAPSANGFLSHYASGNIINTSLTADSQGNIYFGYRNGNNGGVAKVSPTGVVTTVAASAAAGDASINWTQYNETLALSNDEQTLYVANADPLRRKRGGEE